MRVPVLLITAVILTASAILALQLAALAGENGESAAGDEKPSRKVESILVNLVFSESDIRPAIADEIQTAIEEVVNLALIEQLEGDLELIEQNREEITGTLLRVIDLTLDKRGFKTNSLSIVPGILTVVELHISVTGDAIADVRVELVTPSRSKLTGAIFDGIQNELSESLRRRFFGLPTVDKKWLTGLFADALAEESATIPGFESFDYRMELIPSTVTRVVVYLTSAPGEQVIRRHYLRTRSSTILNLSLDSAREAVLVELAGLDGLPISFIEQKREVINSHVENLITGLKSLDFYDAFAEFDFQIRGNDLYATAIIESRKYRTSVSGRVDFNREQNNPRIDGIIGIRTFSSTEVYAAVKFFPDSVDFEPEAGIGINPRPGFFVGGGWDFDRETVKLRGNVWLGTGVVLHAEHYPNSDFNEESEYGVTYYFTKDFAVSAIADGGGSTWIAVGVKL